MTIELVPLSPTQIEDAGLIPQPGSREDWLYPNNNLLVHRGGESLDSFEPIEPAVCPSVIREVNELRHEGVKASLSPTEDAQKLSHEAQARVDAGIRAMEVETEKALAAGQPNPNVLYDTSRTYMPAVNEGEGKWADLRMHALALHDLYNAESNKTLGDGIARGAFDVPLFDGFSAKEVYRKMMNQKSPEVTEPMIARHEAFLEKPIDDVSREFFAGCIDGKAIRTRAEAAMRMVREHLSGTGRAGAKDLVSVSLASGAAAPVYKLAQSLQERGSDFSKVVLADIDPMALAAAHSLAPESLKSKVDLQIQNLLRADLTSFVEPHSADIVDILGLFEYFPERMATDLLIRARQIVRPGGMIIFGNMLDDRPQQTFFKDVVQWPRVQQRSLRQTLAIVEKAGYSLDQVTVTVPSNEGVYAVVGIKIPEN